MLLFVMVMISITTAFFTQWCDKSSHHIVSLIGRTISIWRLVESLMYQFPMQCAVYIQILINDIFVMGNKMGFRQTSVILSMFYTYLIPDIWETHT